MISEPQPPADSVSRAWSGIARTRRVVSSAVVVLTVSMLLSMGSYFWDWSDVILDGDVPERDEWLALAGGLWLPVVAVTAVRLVRVHRALADTAQEAVDAFRDTVATAPGWVWRVDADNRIVFSSPGVRELLGYEPHEVIGRDALDLLVLDEDRAEVLAGIEQSRLTDGWRDWQTRVKHRDGGIRYVRSSAIPVRGKRGTVLTYQGFTVDVTAEVAAAVAEQAERARRSAARMHVEQVLRDPAALQIHFQPIMEIDGSRIVGVEALSRFSAEPYRPPDAWFAEAWQAGLGPDLELHAIALAVGQLPCLPDGAYLSVNADPQTVLDDRFAGLLAGLGPAAARIVVEVTEHAAVSDYETLALAVQRLKRIGVRLAVDDAGAGYASMQHILRLRPDIIKLDRGIVAGIDHDVARQALVTAMAGFAASLTMTVVAEGVETAAELAVLARAGVGTAQGYHLARPAPASELRSPAPVADAAVR
ncbi:EAL domain-containing protein [Actinoplanes sp. NPDC024001]|uniref:sensor domain-containing phosphodiesterase n=1 Tax=Actinoplanes sp. NPDC024001 TaxID=3154598 RepID=UPI0033D61C24